MADMSPTFRSPLLTHTDDYQALWRQVDYRSFPLPEQFNIGIACLDEQDPAARALTVVEPDRTHTDYSFGQVAELSNRLANALAGLGVQRGDVVAVANPQSLETAVFYTAVLRLGAVALPLSSLFGEEALAFRLRDSGARFVVSSQANAPKVRRAVAGQPVTVVLIGDDLLPGEHAWARLLADASPAFTPVRTEVNDPALLIYTSGTTGNPKGVLHAHRILLGQLASYEFAFDCVPQAGDVVWSPADWAWIAGLMDIFAAGWYYGLPIVVDRGPPLEPERVLWLLREHRITLTLIPPTGLRYLRAAGLPGGGFALRALASGGEPVGADLLQWAQDYFGCLVNEVYGQTEFNGICGFNGRLFPSRPGALGRAFPGTVVAVLDEHGQPVVGQVGEIAMGRHHPLTPLGYWRNPEATAQKIRGDWVMSGDLGRFDEDGYLWFTSRADDVIKSSGYRVGPGEIENTLATHPAVGAAAVIGVPDERRGQVPKAFVVLRPGHTGSPMLADELRDLVRSRLAPYEVPREIAWADDLPRTATGKVIRTALRDA